MVVVDLLEAVQIHEQHGELVPLTPGLGQGDLKAIEESQAIGQSGQRIVVGQISHGLAVAFQGFKLLLNLCLHIPHPPGQLPDLITPCQRQPLVLLLPPGKIAHHAENVGERAGHGARSEPG